jgi:hypothetical protein
MPPLRGLTIYSMLVPMTYVMGYWYFAPPGLSLDLLLFTSNSRYLYSQ